MAQVDLFASAETTHCRMWFCLMGRGVLLVWMLCLKSGRTSCCTLFPHDCWFLMLHRVTMGCYRVLLIAPRRPRKHWFSHAPSPCPRSTLGPTRQVGPPQRQGPDLASQTCSSAALGVAPPHSHSQRLDEAVLRTIGHARAPSTGASYNQNWRVFLTCCRHVGVSVH